MSDNLLKQIVEDILNVADELRSKEKLDLFEQGELVAYAEALCIMQDSLSGYDLGKIGLDFDVDERYLL